MTYRPFFDPLVEADKNFSDIKAKLLETFVKIKSEPSPVFVKEILKGKSVSATSLVVATKNNKLKSVSLTEVWEPVFSKYPELIFKPYTNDLTGESLTGIAFLRYRKTGSWKLSSGKSNINYSVVYLDHNQYADYVLGDMPADLVAEILGISQKAGIPWYLIEEPNYSSLSVEEIINQLMRTFVGVNKYLGLSLSPKQKLVTGVLCGFRIEQKYSDIKDLTNTVTKLKGISECYLD